MRSMLVSYCLPRIALVVGAVVLQVAAYSSQTLWLSSAGRLGACVLAQREEGADHILAHVARHAAATVSSAVHSAALAVFLARYVAYGTSADLVHSLSQVYRQLHHTASAHPDRPAAGFVLQYLCEAARYPGLLPTATLPLQDWFACLRRLQRPGLATALCDLSDQPTRAALAHFVSAWDRP